MKIIDDDRAAKCPDVGVKPFRELDTGSRRFKNTFQSVSNRYFCGGSDIAKDLNKTPNEASKIRPTLIDIESDVWTTNRFKISVKCNALPIACGSDNQCDAFRTCFRQPSLNSGTGNQLKCTATVD